MGARDKKTEEGRGDGCVIVVREEKDDKTLFFFCLNLLDGGDGPPSCYTIFISLLQNF